MHNFRGGCWTRGRCSCCHRRRSYSLMILYRGTRRCASIICGWWCTYRCTTEKSQINKKKWKLRTVLNLSFHDKVAALAYLYAGNVGFGAIWFTVDAAAAAVAPAGNRGGLCACIICGGIIGGIKGIGIGMPYWAIICGGIMFAIIIFGCCIKLTAVRTRKETFTKTVLKTNRKVWI